MSEWAIADYPYVDRYIATSAGPYSSPVWYDWDHKYTTDPDCKDFPFIAELVDRQTGERLQRLSFFNPGSCFIERIALKDGKVCLTPDGMEVQRIVEFRDCEMRRL